MIHNTYIGVVAQAAGTVNAITATYTPAPTVLADKMLLWFRAMGANTTTTPTFSPNGLTARTIVKQGGQALAAGDIPAAGAVMEVCYDEANTRWELINPAASSGAAEYLVYVALLTQSGTNAPVATVLENTLGGTVVWTRVNAGAYEGSLVGAFTANKTWISISQPINGIPYFTRIYRSGNNKVNISTFSTDFGGTTYTEADDILSGSTLPASIEIRVYP